MTEPREHEPVEEAGVDRPEPEAVPAPDTGAWRPVSAGSDASGATVEPEPGEPVVEAETAAPEPVVEPPARAEERIEASDDEPTAVVEGADNEPTAVVPEPVEEPASDHVGDQPAPEPVAEPVVEPVEEPAPEPVAEPVEEPTPEPVAEPVAESVTEPVPEPVEEPVDTSADEQTAVVEETGNEPTAVVGEPDITDSATQHLQIENEPTPPPAVPEDAIFRPASPTSGSSPEPTRMEPLSDEEQRLAAERAARRDARAAALAAPAPVPLVAPAPVIVHKRTNDKFWGALGLFLLRIVLAGIFAIRGLNILTDIPAAQAQFAKTIIPQPELMAIVTGVAAELIALALLLGLLTRVAGLGIALIAGGALAFVYWSPKWSPFVAGQSGFLGEYELLLAVVGVLLLLIGGGGWSLDRSFRAGRERDKQERAATSD